MAIKFNLPKKDIKTSTSSVVSTGGYNKTGSNNKHSYSGSSTSNTPLTKNAQMAGSGASVIWTQPMFFSPLHTPQNWQIASKRRECYQWDRFYYDNEPKVAAGVDFYSIFPMNGFTLECKNKKVLKYFESISKRLRINYWLKLISHEYFLLGDVFPFLEISCPHCFEGDALILTKDGNKFIKDIQVGDYVYTKQKTYEEVIKTISRKYIGDMTTISVQCLPSIKTTSDHEHFVVRPIYRDDNRVKEANWNNLETVLAKDIKIGDYIACPFDSFLPEDITKIIFNGAKYRKKNKEQSKYFDIVLDEDFAELMGWYVAEGSTDSNRTINFSLNLDKEQNIAAKIQDWMLRYFKQEMKIEKRWTNNVLQVSSYSREISGWFDEHCGHGSLNKKVPYFIMRSPQNIKEAFLRGYMSGDGHINTHTNTNSITTISPKLCYDIVSMLFDFGISCYVDEAEECIDNLGIHRNKSYRVSWRIDIKRKNGQGTHKENNFVFLKVKNTKTEQKETIVYNFTVNNNHNYVANMMHTHNCGGGGTLNTGEICNHSGGTIKRIVVLNPDWIEVQTNVLANEPVIALVPDDELKMIVQRRQPKQIYDKLPKKLVDLVAAGMPISLSNRCVSHIKHNASPYGVYGTSMLRRLFTVLAYKTKLMTANWIVAERLILPVRVVKIGDKDRPASPEDIADVSSQLAAVANDPNLTLVTHHAFEYDWYGSTGKIHNINNELEYVGKEILDGLMLNQALLNGEMAGYSCHPLDTQVLTSNGFKNFDDVTEADLIACYNPESQVLEYHPYIARHKYDYNGELVQFLTDKIDIQVTPNHRMYAQQRGEKEFSLIEAKDIRPRAKFIQSVNGFDGDYMESVKIGDEEVSIYDFCKLVGYFVSEGYASSSKYTNLSASYTVGICQNKNGKAYKNISTVLTSTGKKFSKRETGGFSISNKKWYEFFCQFGHGAENKTIPSWVKNLSSECLELILEAAISGDGCSCKTSEKRKNAHHAYYTVSKQLALDIEEIAFKCGYTTSISFRKAKDIMKGKTKKYFNKLGHEFVSRKDMWIVNLSKGFKGKRPALDSRKIDRDKIITKVPYNGKVWCFTVPHGLFVTKRNDKITIQGNSAQVGVEVMIRRLDSWRNELAEWVENHIFLPIAMMQGFIDEEESKSIGETVYITPTIKWNDLNLRDTSNVKQMFIALHDKKLISSQTLLDQFDLDYDQEIEKLREETISVGAQGQMGGPGGGGSPLASMPGGGGGGAPPPGGPPPGGDMGGAPPGGDMGGMGGPPGGVAPAGGAPAGGASMGASAMAPGFKITKRGKGKSAADAAQEQQQPQVARISLTKLERKMYKVLIGMGLPYRTYVQYKVAVAGQQQPFVIDFAVPDIGIGIETDGAKWHEEAEAKARDQQRDQKLAGIGWRILRFKETAIEERMNDVQRIISQNIELAAKSRKKAFENGIMIKEASIDLKNIDPSEISFYKESMEDDLGDIFIIGA